MPATAAPDFPGAAWQQQKLIAVDVQAGGTAIQHAALRPVPCGPSSLNARTAWYQQEARQRGRGVCVLPGPAQP